MLSATGLRAHLLVWLTTFIFVACGGGGGGGGDGSGSAGPIKPTGFVWSHPLPQGDALNRTRLLNNQLIGVTSTGSIMVADSAGSNWSVRYVGPYQFNDIAWNGSLYVLVGSGSGSGVILTSPDTMTWTPRSVPAIPSLNAITLAGSTLIAVGDAGTILTSTDGSTWTRRTSNTTKDLYGVTGGGNAVAVGDTVILYGAADGSSWGGVAGGTGWVLKSVGFSNGFYVAVGYAFSGSLAIFPYNAYVAYSTNGASWTTARPTGINGLSSVAHNGSQWVAVGLDKTVATSANGASWTKQNPGDNAHDFYSIIWNTTTSSFLASGMHGILFSSSNGSSWTKLDSGLMTFTARVHWTGDQAMAVGGQFGSGLGSGVVMTSPNGAGGWMKRSTPVTPPLRAAASNGNQLVAVGNSGTILHSPDRGVTWTQPSSGTTQFLNNVKYLGNQFIAVGMNGTLLTSPDGLAWTARVTNTTSNLTIIASTGSRIVVAGGAIITSDDQGVTWTTRTNPCFGECNDLVWAGNQLVLTGPLSSLYTSADGLTWTTRNLPAQFSSIRYMAWTGTTLYATAEDSSTFARILIESTDGIAWTKAAEMNLVNGPGSLIWTGSRLLATNSYGNAVFTSK